MKIKYIIEYIPLYIFSKVILLLPLNVAKIIGIATGRLFFALWRSRRVITINNITMALGLDEREAKKLARLVFENLGMTLVEVLQLPKYKDTFFQNNIDIIGEENFLEAKSKGKGILFLTAHLGNWEILGPLHYKKNVPLHVVYKKSKNPYVDALIDNIRGKYGTKTIPHRNSAKKIIGAIKKKEAVGILLDQHTLSKESIIIDFFGIPAATNYGLALLSLKTGAPVVPIFLFREKDGRYKCVYEKPIYPQKTDDLNNDIKNATIEFTKIIEQKIREYPEQWFWLHKRWKVKNDHQE